MANESRNILWRIIFACGSLLLGTVVIVIAQDAVAVGILERLNMDRQAMGASPLMFDAALTNAAQRHADDLAAQNRLSHIGSDGSQFWERAQDAGYPLSGGAENVLSRADTDPRGAYTQWRESAAHNANMMNPDYAAVGIAYATAADGTIYFVMVLASLDTNQPRPTPSPERIDPTSTEMLPTADPTSTPPPPTIAPPTVTATNTLDPLVLTIEAPRPTNTPLPPQPRILPTNTPVPPPTRTPLPPDIRLLYDQQSLTLINVSGRVLNLVDLIFESATASMPARQWDTEFLTQSLSGFTPDDCLQVWGLETDYLPPPPACDTRHSWIVVNDAATFWRNTVRFTVRRGDQPIAICDVAAGECDINLSNPIVSDVVPPDASASVSFADDLRFVYDSVSFALINVSGRPLNLAGLRFQSSAGSLRVERWDTSFLTQPLTTFSAGDCLQVWLTGTPDRLPVPDGCQVRHAWIVVGDDADFWRDGATFSVIRDGIRIGACDTSQGTCVVSLSDNFGAAPVAPADTTSNAPDATLNGTGVDIRLYISDNSVALLNISGRALDISGLTFASEGGIFAASRWQTPDLTTSLSTLPAGDCLQVWGAGDGWEILPKPADCRVRHGWLALPVDAQFWQDTLTFAVRNGGQELATCETRVPVCDVNLP